MGKPRVIIADRDFSYIIPLQQKFVADFFEKIDLEIITDERYFEELFSVPQKAEVLIISEALYTQSIQRHDIGNVFVMNEEKEEDVTGDLTINHIYKYTSIMEIFNEIVEKSSDSLNIETKDKKETQVILVYSATGGVGKTTVAMGISACLAQKHKRVLYLNADHLQTFQRMLDNDTPISASDVYRKMSDPDEEIYEEIKHVIRTEQFHYLPPFKAALLSLEMSYSVFEKIALSAKRSREYNYIIIDAGSGFDVDKVRLFELADKVVIVTNQTAAAVYGTNVLVDNITGINSEKYLFVCNNFNKDEENALTEYRTAPKFQVSDYILHFNQYDRMRCSDLTKDTGIQKMTFLVT